ncbi:MAG: hypothetical protein V4655_11640 [Bdellovibrionota bacterium]
MKVIPSILVCVLLTACGDKDSDRDEASSASFTSQESASTSSSSNLDEAMDILSDSDQENSSGATLTLTSAAKDLTRSCVVNGSNAEVSIHASFESTLDRDNRFGSTSQSFTKSADLKRIWSKEGSQIGCSTNLKHAVVDFSADLSGLKTDVAFERKSERKASITSKKGSVTSRSANAEVQGTRSISWISQTVAAGSVLRSKIVSSSATRTQTDVAKDGTTTVREYTIGTASDKPLAIDVTYSSVTAAAPSSRLIKSGTILATTTGKGRVESTFSNLLVSFSDSSCQPESGKIRSSVYAEGSEEASVIIEIEAANGSYVATDVTDSVNPVILEDFEYQLCDLRSFNN